FLFLNAPPPTAIYTLSLHDALPISAHLLVAAEVVEPFGGGWLDDEIGRRGRPDRPAAGGPAEARRRRAGRSCPGRQQADQAPAGDRKSTRLNSSHLVISYAVFCLKK